METLTTIGYWIGGIGFVLCVIAYFVLPKLIRGALKSDKDE